MKKITTLFILIVLGTGVYAQSSVMAKFFEKYSGDQSFTEVKISPKMFSLITNMEVNSPEDKETLQAISKLKGLNLLAKEKTENAKNLYKEAKAMVPKNEYEELMTVRDKDNDMIFYIKEGSGGKINELLMIAGSDSSFVVLSIFGDIDLNSISRIGKKMNVSGLENLEKIDEKSKKKN